VNDLVYLRCTCTLFTWLSWIYGFWRAISLCTHVVGDWVDLIINFTSHYWMEASYTIALALNVIFH
jgi:hypothetical protein